VLAKLQRHRPGSTVQLEGWCRHDRSNGNYIVHDFNENALILTYEALKLLGSCDGTHICHEPPRKLHADIA